MRQTNQKRVVLLACALFALTRADPAFANPTGGVVTGGSATITTPNASTLHIAQHSDRAVIDWRGFDIAPTELTEFAQPTSSSIALNRVNSTSASHIDGTLRANGNIVIVNQNGVVFGSGAQVDANGLVASTADTDNGTFMNGGKLVLNNAGSNPNASVINRGAITAKEAGLVGLVAPNVENHGIITARLGRAQLASGDTATVDFYGDGLLEVAVSDHVTRQLVKNTGTIKADGGVIALTAAAGRNIVNSSIQAGGTLQAQTVSTHQGAIIIASASNRNRSLPDSNQIILTAKLDASGKAPHQKGGAIHVVGDNVALMSGTVLDASGTLGGGEILVGGDYHGGVYRGTFATPTGASAWGNTPGGYSATNGTVTGAFLASLYPNGQVPTASRVFIDSGVNLLANATNGNGGRIVVWSDNGTVFNGYADVSATGAAGNGGFIETSGEAYLQLAGSVNARAAHGAAGTWLLDPADITISVGVDSIITASSPFQSTGGATSNLSVATLVGALNGAANVIISSAAGTGGLGNITFADAVSWNSVRSLTVNASNNIFVNNTITNAGAGDINLNANVAATGSISINSAISTGGNVNLLANRDINIGAGITGNGISLRAANGVTSGTGNLNLGGNLTLGSGALTLISGINGTRPSWTMDATTFAHAGSFGGAIDIQGFDALTINRSLALTSNNNLSFANNTLINLNNNLSTLGTGTISLSGAVVLPQAAAVSVITGNGNVTFGGTVSGTAGGVAETLLVNSGTGTTTFTGALNGFDPTLTAGTISFGSTLGATTMMGAVTLTATNALTLPDVTATSVNVTTTGATGDITVIGNITSTGAVVITSFRDLTLNAARTITAGGTGVLSLKAANGVIAGTGNLNLNGNLSIGSGALTLYSGINGTRPSWVMTAANLIQAGSFGGNVDIQGFNALTINRPLALTSDNNLLLAGNTQINLTNNLSTLGTGTITLNGLVVLPEAAAVTITTGNGAVNFGGAVSGTAGGVAETLTVNSGSGATTFTGALNGFDPMVTASTINFGSTLGQTTTMGAVTLTSATSLTLPDIAATSVNITTTGATADITANGNITATGAVVITAFRDLTLAAAKTITAGGSGALTLKAANGATAGTGNLTLNGNLAIGTGPLTLYSGINGTRPSWTANATTLVHAGSFTGAIDIQGFNNLTIARAIAMVSNVNLLFTNNTLLTLGSGSSLATLGTGTISITSPVTIAAATTPTVSTANQAISFGSTVTGASAASSLTTISGTATTTFTGNLNNFILNATADTISFGGTLGQSTSMGAVTLSSVQTLNLPDITAASFNATTTGASGDINVNGNLNAAGAVTIQAFRDLTLAAAKTITTAGSGNLSLKAANGITGGTGNLTLNGVLNQNGTGGVTLYSGINGTRPSWVLDASSLVHTGSFGGAIDIEGFDTLTINRPLALTTGNNLLLTNNTTTVLNGNLSTLGAGSITVNGPVTLPEAAAISVTSGNGAVTFGGAIAGTAGGVAETLTVNSGTGATTFTGALNGFDTTVTAGTISFGSTLGATTTMGAVALTAANALTLPDITAASLTVTTTGAAASITSGGTITTTGNIGMTTAGATADILINGNLTSGSNVVMTAFRNLTLAAAKTIASGAVGNLNLKAANGSTVGVGALTLNGNLSIGSGNLTLYSGTARPSWTPTATNLVHAGAFDGNVDIQGFNVLTLSRPFDLTTNKSLTIANNTTTALGQNLSTLGTGTITISNPLTIVDGAMISITTANQPLALGAISGVVGGATETLTTNSGTANTTFGVLNGFVLNATAQGYTFGGAMGGTTTMGAVTINGVNSVTLPDITAASVTVTTTGSTGDITTGTIVSAGNVIITAFRDLTVASGKTVTAGGAGALTLKAANGVIAGTGNLNIVGNVGIGTGPLTLYSGINGTRPSWTASATTLVHTGSFSGAVDIQGFNVLTLTRAIALTANNNLSFANNTSLALGAGSGLSTLGTGTIAITNPVTIVAAATPSVTTANQAITFSGTITGGSAASSLTTNSGTATTTFTGNLNNMILNATADTITFGGTLGQTTTMAATTLNSTQALNLPNITAASLSATTTGATGDINVNGNLTSAGGVTILAFRDLTLSAAKVIQTGGTGVLNLKAANGVVAGTGKLTLNGNLTHNGSGAVTLYSGINGTRPDWTVTTTSLAHTGSFGNGIDIQGFNDLTINRVFTLTAGNVNFSNNVRTLTNSNITTAGTGTITIGNPLLLQEAAALVLTTSNQAINLDTVNGTAGGVIETLTTAGGTGTTTFSGAMNGITLTSTAGNFVLSSTFGATTPMVNVTFTSAGALTVPDVTLSGNFIATTSTAATGNIMLSGNITSSGGNISITSVRDLTLAATKTVASGPAGSFLMAAANNVVTGTGNLVLNGNISAGTGALTLLSGVNVTRPNWTANTTTLVQQGASFGAVNIQGLNNFTLNRDLTSSGNILITAYGDLTLNAANTIQNGAANALTLNAGGGLIAGVGNLNLNGKINAGSGAITLLSGINGTRPNYTLDTTAGTGNFRAQGNFGTVNIQGFQDMTIAANLTTNALAASSITIITQHDLTVNSGVSVQPGTGGTLTLQAANANIGTTGNLNLNGILRPGTGAVNLLSGNPAARSDYTITPATNWIPQSTSGPITIAGFRDMVLAGTITSNGAISIITQRDLTQNAATTITAGSGTSLTLQAAGGVVGGTGNLTINGNLAANTGALTLTSGINGTRPSFVATTTNLTGASFGAINITGFQDFTLNRSVTSNNLITIITQRDLTIGATYTVTPGSASALTLQAAGGVITNTGNLNLNGIIAPGSAPIVLTSGINGTRPNYTMTTTNWLPQGGTIGALNITGFQDVTISRDIANNSSVTILAQRDLTLDATRTITTGPTQNLTLQAASGVVTGTGNLTLNGNLSVGSGNVTLASGINGTRPNYTMTTTNFVQQGATIGVLDVQGFQDFTLDRNVTSSGSVTIVAQRDLTINASRALFTGTAGSLYLAAANANINGTGALYLNGILKAGTGNFTLRSGLNPGRSSYSPDGTTLLYAGATFGNVDWQGFATLDIKTPIISSGTINFGNAVNILENDITSTGNIVFPNATVIAEGKIIHITTSNDNVTFMSTLDGTAGGVPEGLFINVGTGTVLFTGAVGSGVALGDITVIADNITLNSTITGTGALVLAQSTAGRAINIGTATTDADTAAGFNLTSAEMSRIADGFSSITIGSLTSGDFTNNYATYTDPVRFLSGNDYITAVAMTNTDPVFIQAVRDVVVNHNIVTSNTTANALTLVAGRNFLNTKGAGSLTTGAGGRWLVYSTNPTGTTGEETLVNAFNRYTCTYGGSCPALGSGNGLLYTFTPVLDIVISNQTYNYGGVVVMPTGYTLQTVGYLNPLDSGNDLVTGAGIFQTSYVQGNNAGTSFVASNNGSTLVSSTGYSFNYINSGTGTVGTRAITVRAVDQARIYGFGALGTTGFTISAGSLYSTDAIGTVVLSTNATTSTSGQYTYSATPWAIGVSGANFTSGLASNYAVTYAGAPTGLTISQRALTVGATGITKVYDGLANAAVTLGDNRVGGDVLTLGYGAASFPDKNVGTGRTVSVSGITVTGTDAGNYSFNTTASTTANITQRALTVTAAGINKVYDGLANASVTLGDNRVGGDVLTLGYGAANFPDKNAGTGRTVNVTGITVTGTDSGNYSFNTTASTTANITQKVLTVTPAGINKIYDGFTAATVTLGDNRVGGDVLTLGYGAANFPDKNVGTARTVNVSGITVTGTDAGNYSFNTTASTTANITQRALTVTAGGITKVYDGLANATVTLGDNRVGGDVLTLGYGAASFPDKNAGTGRTVNVTGITVTGTDSGNYSFNTTASTTADITQRALTVTAAGINKMYDGLANATVTLGDNRVGGDVLTLGYGAASFPDKNAGTGRTVNVSGITVAGTDSGNYSFNTTASTTANITQKALTVTASGINKVYDGLISAAVSLSDDRIGGDVLTLGYSTASFPNKNVGVGKAVNVSGITVTGTDSGNYSFNTMASTTADITQRALTVSATGITKVYDGLANATVTLGDNRVGGDLLTLGYGGASFVDKNAGTGKTVNVSGITVTGTDLGNYSFNTTASTTANITQKALTVTATGINKMYDGLTSATVTLGDDRLGGDVLTLGYGAASFVDKNVGVGKTVNVSGITLTGTDSGNYSFNTTASTAADITQKALTVTATGIDKIYNGLTSATVTLGDNRVSGDVLILGYSSASFLDKNVGTGKVVNVSSITVTGTDSGNYSFNTTASTTADITQRALTVTAAGINKVYDGLTSATVTLGDNRIAGDVLTLGYGAASFADKNAANGKNASVSGITVTGTDSGNYSFNTTASTTANITQKALTVTATGINKVYDGLANATVSLSDNRVVGDVLTLGYGTANFPNKNVGTSKTVNVSGITVTGTDAGNYNFNATAATTADITQRALTVGATGINKVYDGLANATVSLSDDRVGGDVLTLGYGSASFPDKNAGAGLAVNVSGITVTGTDAGNYSFNTTASTTADITQRALTVTAAGINKVYDGVANATVTLADDRVGGDVLMLGYGAANFADKNAANGKVVSVSGITVMGTDSGNYSVNTTASTTANITKKALAVSAVAGDKIYDGLTTASITLGDDRVGGDVLTLGYGAATFGNKNVGVGKTVSVNGITVTGTDSGNYTFNTTTTDTATITQRALTVGATGINKGYDGLANATVTLSDDRVGGDVLTLGYGSASFPDKNVGAGRAVSVNGITVTGTDAGNYSFNTTAATTANIIQKALTVTAAGINKIYDGLTGATVTLGDNRVGGDVLTLGYGTANFADKNVANGKTVSVSGITVAGTDASNYSFNTTALTTANITKKALAVAATGIDKVYDGLTAATVTLGDDRIGGDVLTLGYGAANFADKNAANGKTVSVSGITVTGTDAGNYTFNTTTSTTADIMQRALTVSAGGINKVYDGLDTATVTLGDDRVAGDVLTLGYGAANFADKNAANGKMVSVSGISVTGIDSGNYTFNATASTTANITKKALVVSAVAADKIYDGLTATAITLGDNRIGGDVLTLGYSTATFANKNAGMSKIVTVNGITVTGTDSGNYTFTTTTTDTANIAKAALTVSATGIDKVYNGLTGATVTLSDDRIGGDVLTIGYGSASFLGKNAANNKTVNVSGITVTGTDSGNYTFNTTALTTADITQRSLTVSAVGINKVYDGLDTATVSLSDNRVGGDVLTLGYGAANFADKNAANGKTVNVSGITVTGTDAGNYSFNTTASTTANITKKALAVSAVAADKIYDGLTTAVVTLGDNRIGGDMLTLGYGTATFANKNAGTSKLVTVNGITVTGTDSGNYTFNTTATDTANIAKAALTVSATGIDKMYNGLTGATVALGDDRIGADVLVLGYGAANFADKNAANGKAVSVTGITVTGADAGNYTFNTTASTTANITKRALTVGATGITKIYDTMTGATVNLSDNRVGGDVLTLGYGAANFADKNAANGKTVSVSGITVTGTDAGNYSFNSTASTTANITKKALAVSAVAADKIYDRLTTAVVNLSDNRIGGDVLTLGYGTATFANKNAGNSKLVTVNGITVAGTDSGNYTFTTTTTDTANIAQRALTVTAGGIDKTYDGSTDATVTLGDNRVGGDVLNISYTASYGDKNVGNAKAVSVSGITLGGADAGNYSVNGMASTSATITPRALTVGATGGSKPYDGTTTAPVTLTDNRVGVDVLNLTYAAANYDTATVGVNKPITVTGINVTGADSGNYSFNTSTSLFGDVGIAPADLVPSTVQQTSQNIQPHFMDTNYTLTYLFDTTLQPTRSFYLPLSEAWPEDSEEDDVPPLLYMYMDQSAVAI